jgi:serine/threonine-protein kinase
VAQTPKAVDAGISVGQVFQGKYRVDAILGHGGMGVVAECTHLALNERVAVKMLRQDVLGDADAVSRFIREAQAAVKLKSEYVARVSDVGTFENGVPYMVMEFLDGQDLGDLLKERGVLPVPWSVELMLQTAEALAEAHSLGIVHRDVKPTNLFVTWRPDGSALIKVLDFGISKSPMGTDMQLTQTQSLLGTPAYMSPEQMRSARLVDSRSDIWSLGTVFYEVLEGRRPFEAESFSEMCVKVAVDPPAPMVNTPPGLQQAILRCLAKSPEQRYSNMAEFARDLIPFAQDEHQAHMLVERMQRMLSRSQFNWEGSSTGVSGRVHPVRDAGSSPARSMTPPAQWSAGSDPAASPWQGKSNPEASPWHGKSEPNARPWEPPSSPNNPLVRDASRPYPRQVAGEPGSAPMATVNVRPKRRWPLVLGALALLGIGGAVAAVALSGGDKPKPTVAQPAVKMQTDDVKQPDVKQPEVKQPDVKQPDVVQQPEVKQPEIKQPVVKKQPVSGTKGTAKTGSGTKVQTTAKTHGDEVKKDATAPVETTKKPCDPFGSMHGCSDKTQ